MEYVEAAKSVAEGQAEAEAEGVEAEGHVKGTSRQGQRQRD